MSYDNTNRGALFKNTRKAKDTHPDYNGSLNVEGVEYYIDAWLKDTAKGKILSLSVKRKDAAKLAATKPAHKAAPADDFEDDAIPF